MEFISADRYDFAFSTGQDCHYRGKGRLLPSITLDYIHAARNRILIVVRLGMNTKHSCNRTHVFGEAENESLELRTQDHQSRPYNCAASTKTLPSSLTYSIFPTTYRPAQSYMA